MTTIATLNGVTIASSEETVVVEGNHYFPEADVNFEFLEPTRARSLCFWKGIANYWTVRAEGATLKNAAWGYRRPTPFSRRLVKGRVAFWNGIDVRTRTGEPATAVTESRT